MKNGYVLSFNFNKELISKFNKTELIKVTNKKYIFLVDGYIRDKNDKNINYDKTLSKLKNYIHIKNFLKKNRGAFNLIIYSHDSKNIIIARDYDGSKQIYYTIDQESLKISNQPKYLFNKKSYLNNAICEKYLTHRYNYSFGEKNTFIENLNYLESATILNFKNLKLKKKEIFLNSPLRNKKINKNIDYNFHKNNIPKILKNTFLKNPEIDNSSIIGLSGGLDSTSVAATLGSSNIKLDAFTAYYGTSKKTVLDESKKASLVAKRFCNKWFKIKIDSNEFLKYWKNCYRTFDFPVCTSSFLGYLILYKKISKFGYKKIINAGNSDLFFYGNYPCYLYRLLDLYYSNKSLFKIELNSWIKNHSTPSFPKSLQTFLDFKKNLEFRTTKKLKHIKPKQEILKNDYFKKKKNIKIKEHRYKYSFIGSTYLEAYIKYAIWMGEKQPNILPFDEIEKSSKVNSLDPYLSETLKEYFYNLPDSFKIKNGIGKKILRDAFTGILPSEITKNYDKTGFNVPFLIWLTENKKFERFIINLLKRFEKNIKLRKFKLNYNFNIQKLISDITNKKLKSPNIDMIIWQITNLQLWYEENF